MSPAWLRQGPHPPCWLGRRHSGRDVGTDPAFTGLGPRRLPRPPGRLWASASPAALTQGFPLTKRHGGPQLSPSAWLRAGGWSRSGSRRGPSLPGWGCACSQNRCQGSPPSEGPAARGCTRHAPTSLQSPGVGEPLWPRDGACAGLAQASAVEGAGTPSCHRAPPGSLSWWATACLMLAGADPPRHPTHPMTQLCPGLSWVWNWASPCTQAHCFRLTGTGLPQGYAEHWRGGGLDLAGHH